MADAEWQRVLTEADAAALMEAFGDFHDACVHELHMWTDHWVSDDLSMAVAPHLDHRVRMVVQRQFRPLSAIEMFFEEVTRLNVAPAPDNYGSEIFEATLLVTPEGIFWADGANWQPTDPDRDECTWMSAKRLRWRDASTWMGESLRYGPAKGVSRAV